MEIIFENPFYLFFLLSLPLLIIFHYVTLKHVRGRVLQFANFIAMSRISTPQLQPRNIVQLLVRLLTLTFIVLAVSGMYVNYLGIGSDSDYVLAIDISSSMLSTDILPTRIEAAKEAAKEFVKIVPEKTKLSLVAFSGTTFIEQKLTEERSKIIEKIDNLEVSFIGGTDLGEAIISSANLLLSGENSKTIILLTDGRSNIGVSTSQAITYVNENNVQVFTIGIGTAEGGSPDGLNVTLRLDEALLQKIAKLTEGNYTYAQNKEEIKEAYNKIINIQKRKISLNMTFFLMILTLIFSFLDWLLMNTKYKRIP